MDKSIERLKPLVAIVEELKILNTQYQLWQVQFEHQQQERDQQMTQRIFIDQTIITIVLVIAILGFSLYGYQYYKKMKDYRRRLELHLQIKQHIKDLKLDTPGSWFTQDRDKD